MGDNLVFLTSSEGYDLVDLLRASEEWLEEFFEDFIFWSPTQTSSYRLVWVRCAGLPSF